MKNDAIFDAMRVGKKGGPKLSKRDPGSTKGVRDKQEAREGLAVHTAAIDELQYKLYAEAKTALLIVFQALDTGGKDGAIRKVFGPANPQGVRVASFKRPTLTELAHEYLWRIHRAVPERGMIGVFNRSHYEDVLVHKVHKLVPDEVLAQRYRQINDFERHLSENGVVILKLFLNISKGEQKKRLQSRLDNSKKRWKFETGDLTERKFWDKYQDAYQAVFDECSPDRAPWYVIPADNKWYRDWAVSGIVARELRRIAPRFPEEEKGLDSIVIE